MQRTMRRHLQRKLGALASGVLSLALGSLALAQSSSVGSGYWHTSGNEILDANGNQVRIAGINWYGFETTDFIIHGLWAQDYHSILNTIKSLGYNVIRMPFSNQMVESNPVPTNFAASTGAGFVNTDLKGLTAFQVMDKIIQTAGNVGLRVILDNHRSEAGNSNEANGLWYTSAYPQANWIADWETMVNRYSSFKDPGGNPIVIGVDLRNEPHLVVNGSDTGACWTGDTTASGSYRGCPVTNTAQNWPVAAEAAGNAVLAINPNLLIFVEGIDCYSGLCDWQGGNLAGVASNPVVLNVPNQLVYSAHDYGPNLFQQPWFTSGTSNATLQAIWNKYWNYINANGIAPVWVGEFGTDNNSSDIQNTAPGSQGQWFEDLVAFIQANPTLNWTYWALDGEDSFALLDSSYSTPASATKQSMLAAMQFPLTGGGGLACPVPTAVPTNFTGTAASSSQINLSWTGVPPSATGCTNTYDIFSSTTPGFTPSSSNLIASGVTGTTFSATGLKASTEYFFAAETVNVTGATQPSSILGVETLAGSTSGFTLTSSTPSLSVTAGGNSVTDTVTVADTGGFTGGVMLAASTPPTGVTATLAPNPTNGTSVLTLTADRTAASGSFTLTITGTSGGTTATTTIRVTVSGGVSQTPGFTLTPASSSVNVAAGASTTDTITIADTGGFTGAVTLSVASSSPDIIAQFATNPATTSSVLTVSADSAAAAKPVTLTITGTGTSSTGTALTASATVTVIVGSNVGGACKIGYSITNQWTPGFQFALTITNNSSTALSSWTLTWAYANGQQVTQLWNGIESQSGANVSVTNESYNGTIGPGISYTAVGGTGTWSGTNSIPTAFSLNGMPCTVN
jgi:endoglucanase